MKKSSFFIFIASVMLTALSCKKKSSENSPNNDQKRLASVESYWEDNTSAKEVTQYQYNNEHRISNISGNKLTWSFQYSNDSKVIRISKSDFQTGINSNYNISYQNGLLKRIENAENANDYFDISVIGSDILFSYTLENMNLENVDDTKGTFTILRKGVTVHQYQFDPNIHTGIGAENKQLVFLLAIIQSPTAFNPDIDWRFTTEMHPITNYRLNNNLVFNANIKTDNKQFVTEKKVWSASLNKTLIFNYSYEPKN